MSLKSYNLTWQKNRLVQVETKPHHLAGILAEIRDKLEDSDCTLEDIYSTSYDCEEDSTKTFYNRKSVESGLPEIFTYVVSDCKLGEEFVVNDIKINTLEPALEIRKNIFMILKSQIMKKNTNNLEILISLDREKRDFVESAIPQIVATSNPICNSSFDEISRYVLEKNAELYRRLA